MPCRGVVILSGGVAMVRGMGKPGGGRADKRLLNTQYCVGCKERKSMTRFDVVHGLCAECSAERGRVRRKSAARNGKKPKKPLSTESGPKTWKCPNCVKRVEVDATRTRLVHHLNARGQRCAGSGYPLPEKSEDALDYRVAGSFEGGG